MTNRRNFRGASCSLVLIVVAVASPVRGQSLARRVASAPEGRVQFSFAARPGVCGKGLRLALKILILDGNTASR